MFVRTKKSPNTPKTAVQIVQSIRKGKIVKQKIIRHLGFALNDTELKALMDLAEHIKANIEAEETPTLFPTEDIAKMAIEYRKKENNNPIKVDLNKIRHEKSIITGIHDIYGKVYNELGFDKIFTSREVASGKNLFNMVMSRIAQPSSKRRSVSQLSENYGKNLSLQSVYRMMDNLSDAKIKKINDISYSNGRSIFNEKIKVMFYDCTTLYFESFTEDELKKKGYSKDNKFNQPQVLLALLTTVEGYPIGYELFPGSTYEGHTLLKAIEKIREEYKIEEVIFTADSGILSNSNLKLFDESNISYIVGARIKNLDNETTKKILDKSSYKAIESEGGDNLLKEIKLSDNSRMIISYSQRRAEKDRGDRESSIKKLEKKLSKSKHPSGLISNYGYKKYLKIVGDSEVVIDKERLEQASQWDGLHGIITNVKDMDARMLTEHYHSLWEIEDCFRVSKYDLRFRPIYHWTPKRVKSHIAICFIALVCVRYMRYRLKLQYKNISAGRLRDLLNSVKIELLKHLETNQYYGIPTKITPEIEKIYSIMNVKISVVPFAIK